MDEVAQLNSALTGRYEIEREIGAGGMATVYVARDARHDRRVALKVLRPELGAVLGVERFLAEIRVTANLQHPNLLPLFDSGEADGLLFYVMPYVDGESLRSRLDREKQLPIDEAVRMAGAVASALDYAHRHGVIHRDLKPENILLHEGQPLVADFGIALAVSNAGGHRITQTGLSLGTPQYMSPEQATGDRTIDGRTDIYSLGAMLYEMLTGDPPHLGSTAQAIIAKVLTERPRSVRLSRPNVPVHVQAAVEHALEKLPADRFETAHAFADALRNPSAGVSTESAVILSDAKGVHPRRRESFVIPLLRTAEAAIVVAALAFGAYEWRGARVPAPAPVLRVSLVLPKGQAMLDALAGSNLALSPNGDRIAYLATANALATTLWVRPTNTLEIKSLTPIGSGARTPAFSPDGAWIAFVLGNDVEKVSVEGGPAVTLASMPDFPQGISWGKNGTIAVGTSSNGLFLLDERGGPIRPVPKLSAEASERYPVFLPDGETIVYQSFNAGAARRLGVVSLDGRIHKLLDTPANTPVGYLAGHLLYVAQSGTLMGIPFDTHRRETSGTPVPLIEDVMMDPVGAPKIALSNTGVLLYRSGTANAEPVMVRGGAVTPLTTELHPYSTPRFSPDGQRVAFTIAGSQSMDIWVFDRPRGTLTRVTSGGANQRPEWTPDGKRIVFVSDRGESPAFWWQAADGSAPAEMLYRPKEGDPFEAVISPDGKWLVYRTGPAGKPQRSIFAVALSGTKAPITSAPITIAAAQPYAHMQPRISPDGHWIAYRASESGRFEVYVRPFPTDGARVQVSADGGAEPLWSRDGHTLYYRDLQGAIFAVSVSTSPTLSIGQRRQVVSGDYFTNPSHANFDVSPDGSSLLLMRRAGEDVSTILVYNWVQELIAKTSTPK